jgi:hypothetical protein
MTIPPRRTAAKRQRVGTRSGVLWPATSSFEWLYEPDKFDVVLKFGWWEIVAIRL